MSVAKRVAAVAIAGVLAAGTLAACGNNGEVECESMALTTVSFVEKGGRGGGSSGSRSSGSKSSSKTSKFKSGSSKDKKSKGTKVKIGSYDDCDDEDDD